MPNSSTSYIAFNGQRKVKPGSKSGNACIISFATYFDVDVIRLARVKVVDTVLVSTLVTG